MSSLNECQGKARDRGLAQGGSCQGHFGSVETIVLAHQAATIDVAVDDHAWAKPLIDDALAALDRGEGSTLANVVTRLKDRMAARR
jgi:hypothetical protein